MFITAREGARLGALPPGATSDDIDALQRLWRALDTIVPLDPPEVAHFLYASGFAGRRCHSGDCPLARYLADMCGRAVAVGGATVAMLLDNLAWLDVTLPHPAATFVDYFDGGQYSYLLEGDR